MKRVVLLLVRLLWLIEATMMQCSFTLWTACVRPVGLVGLGGPGWLRVML